MLATTYYGDARDTNFTSEVTLSPRILVWVFNANAQTVRLPEPKEWMKGYVFTFLYEGTGFMTVNDHTGSAAMILSGGGNWFDVHLFGLTEDDWDVEYYGVTLT